MALMAAWVYVFDTIQKEREMLETPEQDVYGDVEAGVRVPRTAQVYIQKTLHLAPTE